MRLVELLARELEEWPEGADCVWQSEVDMEVYFGAGESCFEFFATEAADDRGYPDDAVGVTREEWVAERARLASTATAEWNGEGLPPVGTVCEYHSKDNEWMVCEVVAHRNNAAVVLDAHDQAELVTRQDFRPIRTQEQITAQEREQVLDDIYRIIRTVDRPGNKADMAEALYDAGYRKQEQSE